MAVAGLAALGTDTILNGIRWRQRPRFRLALWLSGAALAGTLFIAAPLAYARLFQSQRLHQELAEQTWTATDSFALTLVFLAAAFAYLLFARYRLLPRAGLASLAVVLTVVDIFAAGSELNPSPADPTQGFRHQSVVDFLKAQPGLFRIDSVTGVEDIWQPDTPALEAIPSIWGLYDPLVLTDYYWLWKIQIPGRSSVQYDLLNARYVLGHKDVVLDWEKFRPVFTDDPAINVYENPRALPRAFVVGKERRAASHDEALQLFKAQTFGPRQEVIVEDADGPPLPSQDGPPGQAEVASYSPNGLTVRTELDRPGYLVLSEVYYPGWQARVDGKPQPILRADWAFRAVRLEPGSHVVDLSFRPRSFILGATISGLSLGAVSVVFVFVLARGIMRRRAAAE